MERSGITRASALIGLAAAGASAAWPARANAAEKVRVAKSVSGVFAYTPIDVGLARGIYQKAGVDIDVLTFGGSSKMHAAMIGGELDVALGSGSTMIDILKGEPSVCVAQTIGPPTELGVMVPYDSPIRTVDELKGKTIGVATVGSPTEWLAFELSKVKGWGPRGVRTVATGGGPNSVAALRAHTVDAVIGTAAVAFLPETQKVIRLLLPCSEYVTNFVMHTIYASTAMAQSRQPVLRAFLQAWFETVVYMRAHQDEAVRIAAAADGLDVPAQAREYRLVAPSLSTDGRFSRPGLAALARSYVDLQLLDSEPDMSKLYTEQFLPRAPGR
jgi:NitT/TauT family transport system substrate-binding protein